MRLIRWTVWAMIRVLLSLRYWMTIKGKDEVLKRPGPYLILPNHPAYIEAPNVIVRLWPTFQMRPMLLETNFESPILAPFASVVRAIRVPDTDRASVEARSRVAVAVDEAVAALKSGENVIIWASGRLQRDGTERIGGARIVADVLAAVPQVTVVLARSRGFWGSMFSWAWSKKPNLGGLLVRGAGLLLANLVFFAPRRRITLTLQPFGSQGRPEPNREAVNRWLEEWFNADAERETPTFVPHHFVFGPRTAKFPPPPVEATIDPSQVKPDIKKAVAEILQDKLKRPLTETENAAATTFNELGLDSLDAMEISLQVEQRFGFTADIVPSKVGDLWALASGLLDKAPPRPPPAGWFASSSDSSPLDLADKTIPAAILTQAFRNRGQVIVADDLAGAITYAKMLVGAGAMSRRFRDIPSANVGLMLPASVGCDLAFLALHLAGKLPVVLNWTTGPGNLAHAAKIMELTHVITSKAFIDRLHIEVAGTKFVFLEDIRAGIGKLELLRRLLAVRLFAESTRKRLLRRAPTNPHAAAVVLFTSGSEKAPKAVPLTHDNILATQRAIIAEFHLSRSDSIIGFLPMFHSFGLVITTVLPLVVGIRVVHHPDPTDAGALARKTSAYKPTLIAGTPTFMGYILDRAKPGDLDSLRMVVFGAEKCPQMVIDKVNRLIPGAEIVEGYGITECSAVVSVHRPGAFNPDTLGHPLADVEVWVTDLETERVLPQGKMGMLNVRGPNVFPGYISYDGPSPFRELDGKRWYVTGDLGEIDSAGEIVFRGRLKRFLKAGGEMISLPALEEPFARLYPPTDDGPQVAVEGVETPDGRRIVLFTTRDISLRDANALLQKEGFGGVLRLDEVQKLEAIPVLGTGKTDYKVLRALIEKSKEPSA